MIFLDTSYIIGLIIKNDHYCDISRDIRLNLRNESKITNITVLAEVLNSINRYNFHGDIEDLVQNLLDCKIFHFLTEADYNTATNLFCYYNFSINFSDCTILESMQKHGITKIASFDSDFDKIRGIQRISGFN
jgi:hypothetical protein